MRCARWMMTSFFGASPVSIRSGDGRQITLGHRRQRSQYEPGGGSGGDVRGLVTRQFGKSFADDLLQLVHVDEAARGLAHGIEHLRRHQ